MLIFDRWRGISHIVPDPENLNTKLRTTWKVSFGSAKKSTNGRFVTFFIGAQTAGHTLIGLNEQPSVSNAEVISFRSKLKL